MAAAAGKKSTTSVVEDEISTMAAQYWAERSLDEADSRGSNVETGDIRNSDV